MGNRAVIQIQGQDVGIYLHNNGGYDTVKPLLDVAKDYGLYGDDYGLARLAQMMGNFFGGRLNVGVNSIEHIDRDNGDNGTYVIDSQFNIIERLFFNHDTEQSHWDYDGMKKQIKKVNDSFFLNYPSIGKVITYPRNEVNEYALD